MADALSIRDLRKTYKGGHQALKGVSLDVKHGDFFGLLGPNGAGKTTMIGIITSLVNSSAGSVSVYGHDLESDPSAAKACLGLVPQEFNFNMFDPVIEVVANQAGYYGIERGLAYERAEEYLKQLDLWDKRRSMSRNLSGGMKRRLMIARALVHRPRLLILDEPTAGVDIEIRRSMWRFLQDINAAGTTIILTTHYLEEAESLCKNIAILDDGEIIQNTSTRQLLNLLQMETFILDIETPLEYLPETNEHRIHLVDESTIEVEISRNDSVNELFAFLSDLGIKVLSMRNKANRLEELFINLVENEKQGRAVS